MTDTIFFWCRCPDPRPKKDRTPLAAAGAGAGLLVPHGLRNGQVIYPGGDHTLGEITGRHAPRKRSGSQVQGTHTAVARALFWALAGLAPCRTSSSSAPASPSLLESRHLLCFILPSSKCRRSGTCPLGPSCICLILMLSYFLSLPVEYNMATSPGCAQLQSNPRMAGPQLTGVGFPART